MGNSLYIVGALMILLWGIGFFVYGVGVVIHLLLLFAVIAFVTRIVTVKKNENF